MLRALLRRIDRALFGRADAAIEREIRAILADGAEIDSYGLAVQVERATGRHMARVRPVLRSMVEREALVRREGVRVRERGGRPQIWYRRGPRFEE